MKNKYFYLMFIIIVLVFSSSIYSSVKDIKIKKANNFQTNESISNQSDFYFLNEGWENGFNTWITKDEADIGTKWNLTSWSAYDGTGESWHLADTSLGTNGGYGNSWYQVLDTDPITLSETGLQLTFYHRYSVEAPGGAPSGYNGWDGMNVRISTDNGATWIVLTNPTPEYTSSSLYSFGFEHHEGANIPGWAGSLDTWTLVTFDLSAYASKTVIIRFAFASDADYSTANDSTLFGWEIDNILVTNSSGTLYSNNGTLNGLTPKNFAVLGGNLWRIGTDNPFDSLSFASCNTDSNTYLPNMRNSLSSKYVLLSPLVTDIYFDFELRGTFTDNNEFPNIDYFGVYIQVQGESNKRFISNLTEKPNGDNFIYSGPPANWSLFSNVYSTGKFNLKALKGKKIRIIFEFYSDADTPIGSGLQIDDVGIYTPNTVSVKDGNKNNYPLGFELKQNYPNPFNPTTKINFAVAKESQVNLSVYNVLGELVSVLVNQQLKPGYYQYELNASNYVSGVYIYRYEAADFVSTKKMILLK